MGKYLIEDTTLTAIADAIRSKTGKTDLIKPSQWAGELDNIKSSGQYLWNKKEIENGNIIGYAVDDNRVAYPWDWVFVGERYTLLGLEPGLYDETGTMIASWDALVNTYGFNISNSSSCTVFTTYPELVTGTRLIVGSGHTNIDMYAFRDCTWLKYIYIPDNIITMNSYAFYNCSNLISATIPTSLTKLGAFAFQNCSNLIIPELHEGITSIGASTFRGCSNLALTKLPSNVTVIGSSAFRDCSNLALTELPAGITNIADSVFQACSNLALTKLPSGVTNINSAAFRGCSQLALTEIPAGVTNVGYYAFYGCSNITSLTFKGTPTTIDSMAFTGCTNLTTINVPWAEGAVANAPWGATNAAINYNYNPYINPDIPEE